MKYFYTCNEAKKLLSSEVKLALRLIRQAKSLSSCERIELAAQKLKQTSFENANNDGLPGNAALFISKTLKTIIKLNGVTEIFNHKEHPIYAIPTVYVNSGPDIVRIQPLADVSPKTSKLAFKMLEKAAKHDLFKFVGCDFKKENVGLWNGRFVVIDW